MTDLEPREQQAITLEMGMLLLGGKNGVKDESLDTIWTVTSVGQRSATILAFLGSFHVKATLKSNKLPQGWKYVRNAPLASQLRKVLEDE